MHDIRLITFDLDDTLWAIAPIIERAERRLHEWLLAHCPRAASTYSPAALRGLRVEVESLFPEHRDDISALRRESIRLALQRCAGPVHRTDEAFDTFWQARNEVEFFADVMPVLDRLKPDYTLAAISNGNACIELTGLSTHFDFGLSARDVGVMKPGKDIFLRAASEAGVTPDQVLHVGDDIDADVHGALGAGMHAAWLDREGREPVSLPEHVIRIRDLHALQDHLEGTRGNAVRAS
ncbi:MAG: HAD-IA family hydrolase [Gammaproteobacteria bacterium]|nr:HAD-IA family hydrolase [Gammaproteobacteria bacterium]